MKILYLTSGHISENGTSGDIPVRAIPIAARTGGAEVRILQVNIRYDSISFWRSVVEADELELIPVTTVTVHTRFSNIIYNTTPLMNLLVRRHYLEQVHPLFQPDLIHAHNSHQAGAMAWALYRMHDIPYLLSEQDTNPNWYFRSTIFSYLSEKVYLEAKWVLPATKDLMERIWKYLPRLEHLEVLPRPAEEAGDPYEGSGSADSLSGRLHQLYTDALHREPINRSDSDR